MQDLTSINRRNDIVNEYTVKLIEKKLPPMIYREWVDEEDREKPRNQETYGRGGMQLNGKA